MSKTAKVSSTEQLVQALAAGYEAKDITIEHPGADAAIAKAKADGIAEGKASAAADIEAAKKAGADIERKRVLAIQKLSRKGFEALATKAIDEGQTPESFALALLTEAGDRGITLDAIKRDAPAAAPRTSPPNESPKTAADTAKSWDEATAKANAQQRM